MVALTQKVRPDRVAMLTAALAPPEYRRRVPAHTLSSILIWIPPAKKMKWNGERVCAGLPFGQGRRTINAKIPAELGANRTDRAAVVRDAAAQSDCHTHSSAETF